MKKKLCANCEHYRRRFCTKYDVTVIAVQGCIETGEKNPVDESPNFIEDDNIDINNVVK